MDYNIRHAISSSERKLADRYGISNKGLVKSIKWIVLAILFLIVFLSCLPLLKQIRSSETLQILLISFLGLLMANIFLSLYFFVRWQKNADHQIHLEALIRTIPGTVYRCLVDKEWTMVFMGDEIEKLSGYPASDFLKNSRRSYVSIIHPEDVEHVERVVLNALDTKKSFTIEYRILNSKNEEIWVLEKGQAEYSSKGSVTFLNGTILDISKQKLMEAKLNAERSKLQKILDSSPVAAIIKTGSRISYVNQRSKDIFGYSVGDPITDSYVNLADRNNIIGKVGKGTRVTNYPLQIYDSKRRILDCIVNYYPIEFDGKTSMLGWYVDVTAQKKIQQKLADAKRTAEQIIESMPVGIVAYNPKDLKVLNYNRAFLDFHSIESIEHLNPDILEDSDERKKIQDKINKDGFVRNQELLVRRYGTGEFVLVQFSLHPMNYDGNDAVIVSFVDISNIRKH